MTTRTLKQIAAEKTAQWSREAMHNFLRHVIKGGETVRELWANGEVMVGPVGALPNRFVRLEDAKREWRKLAK